MIKTYMLMALKDSFNALKMLISKKEQVNKKSNMDYLVYKCQTETIHWLIDCIERTDTSLIQDSNDKDLISAFKYLNNALKHNDSLTHLDIGKGYITFPISSNIPNTIIYEWTDLSYLKNVQNKSQKKHYDKYLKDHSVISTISDMIIIVEKHIN